MTEFCRAKQHRRCSDWRQWLLPWLLAFVLVSPVWAEGVQALETRVEYSADAPDAGWMLSAGFRLELGQRLEDAVNRGLPLVFVTDVEVTRPRWYWFDEKTVSMTQLHRLSYNALTQQYRVSTGTLSQRFETISDAMATITRVSRLRLGGRNEFRAGTPYEVAVRLRLDVSQLPKPFQVNAMTNREWTLSSDWKRFSFVPTADTAQ